MKQKWKSLIPLMLIVCLCIGTALSDTLYVKSDIPSAPSLRDEITNEVLITIPAGTMLEPDVVKSTDMFAYVTYGGYSGYVLWNALTRVPPAGAVTDAPVQMTSSPEPYAAPEPTPEPVPEPAPGEGTWTLKTVGAVIQYASARGKAYGPEMTELTVTPETSVMVIPKVPRWGKIDYWIINGVRYDFLYSFKWFYITAFDRSWTIEVAYKNSDPQTLRSPDEIQASRTGETLIAETRNSKLRHVSGSDDGGAWMDSFDFTNDYTNLASGAREKGGQLTAKIRAIIPSKKQVLGWRLDGTEFYTAAEVKAFIVRTLDTSMVYEPIFAWDAKVTPTPKITPTPTPTRKPTEKPKITPTPTPTPEIYYNVRCIEGCTFSGGGYSNATSGKVKAGTKVTAHATVTVVSHWYVNGVWVSSTKSSMTRTINQDTTFQCMSVVN